MRGEYPVYIAFRELIPSDYEVTQEDYENLKNIVSSNKATKEYYQTIIENLKMFQESQGTYKGQMLVIAESPEDVPRITKELEELFPVYQLRSQYSMKNGEFAETYQALVMYLIIGSVVSVVVIGIIFSFLNKNYLKNKNRELAILYSLGHSNFFIKASVILENILLFTVYSLLSLGILQVLYRFVLVNASYRKLFSLENMTTLLLVFMGICLLSALWGVSTVKKNNLKEFLK